MTESILAARNVGKSFDGKQVLDDISASVAAGSVIGVLGKNGAGKTTLLEISLGFSPTSSGSVALWGHESLTLPAPIKGRIGYVPQQDELIPLLTGTQQIALNAALHQGWDHELIARLAQEWEVPLDRRISALSGGERQKISLLLALGHRPELLVLDEPLASLDPISRRQFLHQLLEITADQTRAVVFSSHIISDLERVANEVWILREGRMAWQGELDALKESVVRLHLRARDALPARLGIANTLHERVDGNTASISISGWSADAAAPLAARLGVEIEVEPLDLEDIFPGDAPMKGVLRVTLLLFTALPVQRWLLAGGAVMLAAGYLLPEELRVLGLVGLAVSFIPTLFASGVLLRYIIAPRVMQLIPHLRLQMLGAMSLVPIIFATAFTVVTLSLPLDANYLLIWLRVAAAVSAVLITQFVLMAAPRAQASGSACSCLPHSYRA